MEDAEAARRSEEEEKTRKEKALMDALNNALSEVTQAFEPMSDDRPSTSTFQSTSDANTHAGQTTMVTTFQASSGSPTSLYSNSGLNTDLNTGWGGVGSGLDNARWMLNVPANVPKMIPAPSNGTLFLGIW